MKKLGLIICLFSSGIGIAQNYQSLFDSISTSWNMIDDGYCDAVCSKSISSNGDTVLNLNTYKILTKPTGVYGFLREDTLEGKAWFYDISLDTEFLVMNLSLNLGETFIFYDLFGDAIPIEVDSVYILNGKKHVRTNAFSQVCSPEEKITFIEGVGTTAGFSFQYKMNGNSANSYLLCQFKNGSKEIGNKLFEDSCNVCMLGLSEQQNSSFLLYPNPATDILSLNPQQSGDYFITDALGRLVSTGKITANQSLEIATSALSKGMYSVIIVTENKQKGIQKLVVK